MDPDEIFAALDADTRPYLKLLVAGAGKGLRGRGEDLNATLRRLEPLHRDLARVTRATAAAPTGRSSASCTATACSPTSSAASPAELERLVSASGEVFGALAGEDEDISTATARAAGGAARDPRTRSSEVGGLARELKPTLAAAAPADPPARRDQRRGAALLPRDAPRSCATRSARSCARRGRGRPTCGWRRWSGAEAAPDLDDSLGELNRFFNIGAFNPGGAEGLAGMSVTEQRARQEGFLYWLAWTAQNGVSLFSTADAQGPWRRVTICGLDLAQLQPLLSFTLPAALAQRTRLCSSRSPAPRTAAIAPGSPVQDLLDSRFGTCDFNDLPTVP